VFERVGGLDINRDGAIINLAIVGSSRFYDFMVFEDTVELWVGKNGYPDLIIVGGASGVDYMAERWADNNSVPMAVFSEEWGDPSRSLFDRGRGEAANTLTEKILSGATPLLGEHRYRNRVVVGPALGHVVDAARTADDNQVRVAVLADP
jgi:hypothetical protein